MGIRVAGDLQQRRPDTLLSTSGGECGRRRRTAQDRALVRVNSQHPSSPTASALSLQLSEENQDLREYIEAGLKALLIAMAHGELFGDMDPVEMSVPGSSVCPRDSGEQAAPRDPRRMPEVPLSYRYSEDFDHNHDGRPTPLDPGDQAAVSSLPPRPRFPGEPALAGALCAQQTTRHCQPRCLERAAAAAGRRPRGGVAAPLGARALRSSEALPGTRDSARRDIISAWLFLLAWLSGLQRLADLALLSCSAGRSRGRTPAVNSAHSSPLSP